MKKKPQYLVIFDDIVQQIYMGRLKAGDKLDSIRVMTEKYSSSENTIRQAIRLLSENGLVGTQSGKNPIVRPDASVRDSSSEFLLNRVEETIDTYRMFGIFYPPIVAYSTGQFNSDDCAALERIVEKMEHNLGVPQAYRQHKSQFLQKLVSKSGNPLMGHYCQMAELTVMLPRMAADSSGPQELSLPGARRTYTKYSWEICAGIRSGNRAEVRKTLARMYHWVYETVRRLLEEFPDAQRLAHEIQNVPNSYLYDRLAADILHQMYLGKIQQNELLLPVSAAVRQYQVSLPTVRNAYRVLNEYGVARTVNGKGTYATMCAEYPEGFEKTSSGAIRLKKFLEAVQFLAVTTQDVALYAAGCFTDEQVCKIEDVLWGMWKIHHHRKVYPAYMLLDSIVQSVRSRKLSEFYAQIQLDAVFSWYIERFFQEQLPCICESSILHCLDALDALKKGRNEEFAEAVSGIFQNIWDQVKPFADADLCLGGTENEIGSIL